MANNKKRNTYTHINIKEEKIKIIDKTKAIRDKQSQ